jgi:hypothetical protein
MILGLDMPQTNTKFSLSCGQWQAVLLSSLHSAYPILVMQIAGSRLQWGSAVEATMIVHTGRILTHLIPSMHCYMGRP